jgi:uncharacterized protein
VAPAVRQLLWARLPAALVLAASLSVPAIAESGPDLPDEATIQIDLEESVQRTPDFAVVTLGITGDAAERDDALKQHYENVLRILAVIREAGVPAKDIRQDRPLVGPVYETWVEDHREYKGQMTGFRASTRIVLTLRDLSRAGSVIQSVVHSGATYIEAVEFQLAPDRQAEARAEARANAIAKAGRFAAKAAHKTGAKEAELLSAGEPPPPDGAADLAMLPQPREWGPELIIEPGVIEITEKVRATFRLVQ